jgi:hypothetical protein
MRITRLERPGVWRFWGVLTREIGDFTGRADEITKIVGIYWNYSDRCLMVYILYMTPQVHQ